MPAPGPIRLELCPLEAREMPAVSSLGLARGVLTVRANDSATSVQVVRFGANVVLKDLSTSRAWAYAANRVSEVAFVGGAGDDRFVNDVINLRAKAWGRGGDDYLESYNAADYFAGGAGDDTLVGYGGNDQMWGGTGNDLLKGMNGNDRMAGDGGNDNMIGGAGADSMWGGSGNDVLIAIDNGPSDFARGDAGSDAVWADNGPSRDGVAGPGGDRVQWVRFFSNGADRTLNGDNIADPTASGTVYKRFSGPLFGSGGPLYTDIGQGNLGDCWLLAGLSAVALDGPTTLRQNVVDFGDGTYGVHLGNNFYRVDADLPAASPASDSPSFARLGSGGSLWVAVVEKAYAHYRYGTDDYAALEGGWSVEVNRAFGTTSAGDVAIQSYWSAADMADAMHSAWADDGAVTFDTGTAPSGAPLISTHMYTVVSFTRDSGGQISHVTLRNPWGVDGAGSDSNPNDALVSVSIDTLYACIGRVNWGRV
jgi:hypothetical protein